MTPFDVIKKELQAGMVQGNMHACLRDTGRLAGGYAAGGHLSVADLMALASEAEALSQNAGEGRAKWEEAVAYGRNEPVNWQPSREGHELDWDGTIGAGGVDEMVVVKQHWIEDEEIEEPQAWQPVSDLTQYLSALFDAEDHVGYVTEAWYNQEAERWLPKRGAYDRTAGQLIEALGAAGGDMGSVFGDYNPEVGAWIRFNPLDGSGVKDINVTKYRHALVECDNVPIPRQMALIKELQLPVTVLVHSGGKSLHAIVKVDANDYKQYQERVDFLYEVCAKNGLSMDRQNRNPSRLSRMPGAMRGDFKQWLVATEIGQASWQDWKEHIEAANDDLPEIETLELSDEEPELAPELIGGVLREGHKLLLSGPSKAGKSFSLIQLSIAFAEGGEWLGWKVKQGRCLYVNLELDARSAKHRYWSIYRDLNIKRTAGMVDVWNLRGKAASLDQLTPKLVRRAKKNGYSAVIIDPTYKVLTGDENSAAEMAAFCNWFDRICLELKAATIYCHHHSKGAQGQKNSKDRSSGSGVFARDPDAIIDLIELTIDDERRKQIINRWQCEAIEPVLDRRFPKWRGEVSQDDALVAAKLMEYANRDAEVLEAARQARITAEQTTGWRVETTLREFPTATHRNAFFRYPIHEPDRWDFLKDAKADGEESPQEKFVKKRQKANKAAALEKRKALSEAMETVKGEGGMVRLKDVMECLGKSETAVRNGVKGLPGYAVENGLIIKKFGKA